MAAVVAERLEAERVELWFMDETRAGEKGRATHVWFEKGTRPRGTHDIGFASAWLFGGCARSAARRPGWSCPRP